MIERVLKELPQPLRTQIDTTEFIWADDDVNRTAYDLGLELNSYVVAYRANSRSLREGTSLCSTVEAADLEEHGVERLRAAELSLFPKEVILVAYKRPLKVRLACR